MVISTSTVASPLRPQQHELFRFMPGAPSLRAPKILLRRHAAAGRKTRGAVFLGSLILTTCPEVKPDGNCAKAPRHQYVPRGRRAPKDVDCRGDGSPVAHAGVAVGLGLEPATSGRWREDQREPAGAAVAAAVHPTRAGEAAPRGAGAAALGERLPAGHQAGPPALLQRGNRVPPAGAARRLGQRRPPREPPQSDRDLHRGPRRGEPVRSAEPAVRGHESSRPLVRNGGVPQGVYVQGEPAG